MQPAYEGLSASVADGTDADGDDHYEAFTLDVRADTRLPNADLTGAGEPYFRVEIDGRAVATTERVERTPRGQFRIALDGDDIGDVDRGTHEVTVRLMDEDVVSDDEIDAVTVPVALETTTEATATTTETTTQTTTTRTTTSPTTTDTTTQATAQPTGTTTTSSPTATETTTDPTPTITETATVTSTTQVTTTRPTTTTTRPTTETTTTPDPTPTIRTSEPTTEPAYEGLSASVADGTDADGDDHYEAFALDVRADTRLPDADLTGAGEPYFRVEIDGRTVATTERVERTARGQFRIALDEDDVGDVDRGTHEVTVRLMDEDVVSDDEIDAATVPVALESTATDLTTTEPTTTATTASTTIREPTEITTTATPTQTPTPTPTTTETRHPVVRVTATTSPTTATTAAGTTETAGTPHTDTATGTVGANATARPAATGTTETATGTIDHDTGPLVEETTTDSGGVPGLGALAALVAIAAAAVLLGRR